MASSRRMKAILDYIRPGSTVYDLCCDHGLMGLEALMNRHVQSVIFVDQSEAALTALRQTLAQLETRLQQKAEIVCLPAEKLALRPTACDVIIAGVGVQTTIAILTKIIPQGLGDNRLILAPQQKSQPLRGYLHDCGYALFDETVIVENGRFREIIVVEAEGEPIHRYGSRFTERDDAESKAFMSYLESYYRDLQAPDRKKRS